MAIKGKRARGFMRGSAAMKQVDDEMVKEKRQKELQKTQYNMPFRLWVPPGETREVIIVDDKPDFFMYEHQLMNPRTKKWDLYLGCTKAFDVCPVCEETGKESYYAMFLTVIDLTPYTDRKGTVHKFSRKLMMVKNLSQQKKFIRRFEKDGTLRGYRLELTRDRDTDPTIGNDIEFVEILDESVLAKYVRKYKDRDGKVHKEDCSTAYVYEELFTEPDSDALREVVGGEPPPGSSKSNRKAFSGEDDWEDEDEDEDEDESEEDEDDKDDDKDDEEEGEDEDEDEDEDDDDSTPWEDDEDDEDEDDEDEEPRPSKRSAAKKPPAKKKATATPTRRAALRGVIKRRK